MNIKKEANSIEWLLSMLALPIFPGRLQQVLSAEASLTSVFGMGTGGPSPNQHQLLLKLHLYSNKPLSNCQVRKMVTRTGIEPMLTA